MRDTGRCGLGRPQGEAGHVCSARRSGRSLWLAGSADPKLKPELRPAGEVFPANTEGEREMARKLILEEAFPIRLGGAGPRGDPAQDGFLLVHP